MKVNRADLALIFGVSLPTVTAWHKEGMPCEKEGRKGVEWVFDTVDCIEWYMARKFKPRGGGGGHRQHPTDPFTDGSDLPETIEQAQLRYESARADKMETQTAKELGLLVPVDEVAAIVVEENARVRARLLSIPTKVRPKALVFLKGDRAAAEQVVSAVDEEIRDALGEVQSWAPPDEIGSDV